MDFAAVSCEGGVWSFKSIMVNIVEQHVEIKFVLSFFKIENFSSFSNYDLWSCRSNFTELETSKPAISSTTCWLFLFVKACFHLFNFISLFFEASVRFTAHLRKKTLCWKIHPHLFPAFCCCAAEAWWRSS